MLDNNDNEEWGRYNYGNTQSAEPPPAAQTPQWNEWGIPPNGGNDAGYMDLSYWISRGVNPDEIFDENGQTRPGWARTGNGYEQTGATTTSAPSPPPTGYTGSGPSGDYGDFSAMPGPNEDFTWPTYNAPKFAFHEFPGFKKWEPPTMDQILADPVLQSQLTEGNRRIKQDRAFKGILNSGDTLKDIFDWSSDRIKLGANDAWDRSFKVYDVNERQNPFNTWSANRDLALSSFDRNSKSMYDEFMLNQYEPAKKKWEQNYNKWAKTGDWLSIPD